MILQMVDPCDIIAALDDSVDTYGAFDIASLMDEKLDDCGDWFIDEILDKGIQDPICIQIRSDGWVMGNGHHRLSIAIAALIPLIPVLFAEKGGYMHSEITDSGGEWENMIVDGVVKRHRS